MIESRRCDNITQTLVIVWCATQKSSTTEETIKLVRAVAGLFMEIKEKDTNVP